MRWKLLVKLSEVRLSLWKLKTKRSEIWIAQNARIKRHVATPYTNSGRIHPTYGPVSKRVLCGCWRRLSRSRICLLHCICGGFTRIERYSSHPLLFFKTANQMAEVELLNTPQLVEDVPVVGDSKEVGNRRGGKRENRKAPEELYDLSQPIPKVRRKAVLVFSYRHIRCCIEYPIHHFSPHLLATPFLS